MKCPRCGNVPKKGYGTKCNYCGYANIEIQASFRKHRENMYINKTINKASSNVKSTGDVLANKRV
jgi:hypothetical protein